MKTLNGLRFGLTTEVIFCEAHKYHANDDVHMKPGIVLDLKLITHIKDMNLYYLRG